jgi:5S rRNA maturation endonuclease (ribonuclease M5)
MDSETMLDELRKLPSNFRLNLKGGSAWLCCNDPNHQENTPSAKINLDQTSDYFGRFYCFGCHVSKSWNTFAKEEGLAQIDSDFKSIGIKPLGFRRKAKEVRKQTTFDWPKHKAWRGVSGEIVNRLQGYVVNQKNVLDEPRLILPVKMYDEEVGHVLCLLHDPKRNNKGEKIELSYVNSKGDWVRTSFLGFDEARKMKRKPLWIVEGPRDLCRAIEAGLRVVALLGSHFDDARSELIRLLNPPALMIATDNDKAGNMVAEKILDELGDEVPCIRLRWGKDQDTFDQTVEHLQKLNNKAIRIYGETQ